MNVAKVYRMVRLRAVWSIAVDREPLMGIRGNLSFTKQLGFVTSFDAERYMNIFLVFP
jgi:hypothetical protein